jgi:acylphosphatase
MSDRGRDQGDFITVRATVHGRVQGVGFRFSARSKATRLGVAGWVRNDPSGTVSVLCEGPRNRVERFLEWLRQGPPSARVTKVNSQEEPYRGEFSGFGVKG